MTPVAHEAERVIRRQGLGQDALPSGQADEGDQRQPGKATPFGLAYAASNQAAALPCCAAWASTAYSSTLVSGNFIGPRAAWR
jgi:hypothetical protein